MQADQPPGATPDPGAFNRVMRAIEDSIGHLSDGEKLQLIGRIARSVPSPIPDDPERTRWQYENMIRLMEEMEALPSAPNVDEFSNRDHDRVLYGSPK